MISLYYSTGIQKKFTMDELVLTTVGSGSWIVPYSGNYKIEVVGGGGKGGNGGGRTSSTVQTGSRRVYDEATVAAICSQFSGKTVEYIACVNNYRSITEPVYTTYYYDGKGGSAGGAGAYASNTIYLTKGTVITYTVGGPSSTSSFGSYVSAAAGAAGGNANMSNRTGGTGTSSTNGRGYGRGGDGGTGADSSGNGRTNGQNGTSGVIFVNYAP